MNNDNMKFLLVLMKYDYGVEDRGFSYEYYNIYLPFIDVFGENNVILYDFMSNYKRIGKAAMNQDLIDTVASGKPDITLFCLFEDEFEFETIQRINEYSKTVSYFIDDPWRQKFARYWIKFFNYFTTPDYFMFNQYISEGFKNVIYAPFGFNSSIYVKKSLPKIYDVTFIGGQSPLRRWIISLLKKEGINIKVFGRGWSKDNNWISQEQMVDIINQSKINLNLSNGICYDFNFLLYSVGSLKAVKEIMLLRKNREQVKGRHYEINGCGGFQLSYYVQGLNTIYNIDKEIAVFDNIYNLSDTIKFYLKNDNLRNTIAENGYKRSLSEHTAQNYVKKIINEVCSQNNFNQ